MIIGPKIRFLAYLATAAALASCVNAHRPQPAPLAPGNEASVVSAPTIAQRKHEGTEISETELEYLEYLASEQTYFLKMPFVQDAVQRWSKKSGEPIDRMLKSYRVQVMLFPEKACVKLAFKIPAVGGVPSYCYRVKDPASADFVLVEDFSDVE